MTTDPTALLDALAIGEDTDWEFKSAQGGLPASVFETYAAMANTDGGTIVLGVADDCTVTGVADAPRIRQELWNRLHNPQQVSANLLADGDVAVETLHGKSIVVMRVPRADRWHRPVHVGKNPLEGTYRRHFEGDFRCTPAEVRRMIGDSLEDPVDGQPLEHFSSADFDPESVKQYRNRFRSRDPDHPWTQLADDEFLQRIGALATDRRTGVRGATTAGLVLFGKDEAIRDPHGVPAFHLDYREKLSDDLAVRWTDRITEDGKWVCNVFQFYQRVILRLVAELKTPFALDENLVRRGETIVHEAVREALVNALIHADYRGQGGIVIEQYRDRFEMSNPGVLLVSREQLSKGGISECRNRTLQKLFSLLGFGEKAGSGLDKIRQGWRSQHWREPYVEETVRPDRVRIVLPMVSLLPEAALRRLEERFGAAFRALSPLEVQALVTAEVEGRVTNARLRAMSVEHPTDITKALQGMVARGFLSKAGARRWSFYRVGEAPAARPNSPHNDPNSPHKNSPHNDPNSPHNASDFDVRLLAIARPARERSRLAPERMREIILQLCRGRYLTAQEVSALVQRDVKSLQLRFFSKLLAAGALRLRYPDEPNHPSQAYTSDLQNPPADR